MKKKYTSTVAGASLLITAVGLVGKGLGLIREVVFANYFGLNTQYDLYLVGAVLPITINTVILYLAQNYLIPNYNKVKVNDTDGSYKFVNSTFWSFTFFGAVLSLILFYFSGFIIKYYLQTASAEYLNSTLYVFRIFLLTIPLNSAFSVLAAFLQAEFEFKTPAVSQLLLNISIIFLVVIFSNSFGVYAIPAGYLLGSLIQLIFLLVKSKRKIRFNFFNFIKDGNVRSIINYSLVITILIESISQIYLLADRYFFDSVQKGGIASLNYAMNIFLLPVTIISVALSTAIFPKLSHSFSSNMKEDVQKKLDNFYSINLFLFIPISFVLILYGDVIIRILFQRGEFDSNAVLMTFGVLKYYALSLVFYSSYTVINKLMYGANLGRELLLITVAGCLLKVFANFILVKDYEQNGLAISTSISYMFFFLVGAAVTVYKLKMEIIHFIKEFFFNIFNGILSSLISILVIPGGLFSSALADGFLRLVIFLLVYAINSKLVDQSAVKLFEEALGSLYPKRLKLTKRN